MGVRTAAAGLGAIGLLASITGAFGPARNPPRPPPAEVPAGWAWHAPSPLPTPGAPTPVRFLGTPWPRPEPF